MEEKQEEKLDVVENETLAKEYELGCHLASVIFQKNLDVKSVLKVMMSVMCSGAVKEGVDLCYLTSALEDIYVKTHQAHCESTEACVSSDKPE